MSGDRTETAERLFDDFAANLSMYYPESDGMFGCPLCLRLFPRIAIHSGDLTLEHIIPSSLGGKLLTLTCAECNSQSGSRLEAHLVQRLRIDDTLAGKSKRPLNARVRIGEGEFGANIYLSADRDPNLRIVAIESISDPELLCLAREQFSIQSTVQISGRLGFKPLASQVAILRMAYLLMFSYFGYGYILHQNLDQVRRQLNAPDEATAALNGMFWLKEASEANVVGVVTEPDYLRCFLAILDLSTVQRRRLGVVMPGLDPGDQDIYERWQAAAGSIGKQILPEIDILFYSRAYVADPTFRFLPARIWRGQVRIG